MALRRSKPNLPARAPRGSLTANQVVATNIKLIRERIGWTQSQVADALSEMTGNNYTKATISAMERSSEGGKKRLFDAQELLEFSRLFYVPIVWFFIPSRQQAKERLDIIGKEHGIDLLHFLFGDSGAERQLKERLTDLREDDSPLSRDAAVKFADPVDREAWRLYAERRSTVIETLLAEETGELEAAIDELYREMDRVRRLLDEARRPPR